MTNYHATPEKEQLTRHPEIAPYFYDLNTETVSRAFYNTSHRPESMGASTRAGYALELIFDKNSVLEAVERAITQQVELNGDYDSIYEVWFKAHRASCASFGSPEKRPYWFFCSSVKNSIGILILHT